MPVPGSTSVVRRAAILAAVLLLGLALWAASARAPASATTDAAARDATSSTSTTAATSSTSASAPPTRSASSSTTSASSVIAATRDRIDAGARSDAGTPSLAAIATSTAPIHDPSVEEAIAAIATMHDRLEATREAMLARGMSPETVATVTSSLRTQEAALRLTQLAAGDPTWDRRTDEYDAQREALGAEPTADQLDALRTSMFTPAEQERLRAHDALMRFLDTAP